MKRITEEFLSTVVLVPASIAASTLTASGYVSCAETGEVTFLVSTGALASGKKLTVEVYGATDDQGTGAVKVAEKVFTAGSNMTGALAMVSCKPSAQVGPFVGVKIQHDAAAAVICGVTALSRVDHIPADNDWVLNVAPAPAVS